MQPVISDIPIQFDKNIPEIQVRAPYQQYQNDVIGEITITSGFMEAAGHGYKHFPRKAIYRDGQMLVKPPGNYNIGIDYTKGFGSEVKAFYSGTVIRAGSEGGYGYRIHIKLDITFEYEGKDYPVYQAYGHCDRLLKQAGDRVTQGEAIAIEGGRGRYSRFEYPSHVDLDTYALIEGDRVSLNFEILAQGINQLNIGKFQVTANHATVIKYADMQSKDITDPALKFNFNQQSTPLVINWYRDEGTHWLFELEEPINGRYNWYAHKKDVLFLEAKSPRWDLALRNCITKGCTEQTARAQNVEITGPEASQLIARKDLAKLTPTIKEKFKQICRRQDLPLAIALGWSSRKSGFSDISFPELNRELSIFNKCLLDIETEYPHWDDARILKGALVLSNSDYDISSLAELNYWSFDNDAVDDIIARSHYYLGV